MCSAQRQCDVFEQVGGQGADQVDLYFGLWGVIVGKQWAQISMRWVRMGGKEDDGNRDLKISIKMEEEEQRTGALPERRSSLHQHGTTAPRVGKGQAGERGSRHKRAGQQVRSPSGQFPTLL